SAKIQLSELGTICIPLENQCLCPVMPEWRGHNNVLVDKYGGIGGVRGLLEPIAIDHGQLVRARPSIDLSILISEADIGRFVIRNVNGQTSRIRMMTAKGTSRSCGIRLRLLGAGRVLVDHWRKDSSL